MRALLDTNIIIHREAPRGINQDIGMLFKWLDRAGYSKCIHPVSLAEIGKYKDPVTRETLRVKLDSYEQLQTVAPMAPEVDASAGAVDRTDNDRIDTILLNEVYQGRVDILVTEDKQIRRKAETLQIADRVHSIESFLEKITAEFPALIDYKVLSVRQALFGHIDLKDPFFDSFKEDYAGFEKWFVRKSDEKAYITVNNDNGRLLSFLYLKREGKDEAYGDIEPLFRPKRRLKIGTFKVLSNGFRLGERFLRIVFDNALARRRCPCIRGRGRFRSGLPPAQCLPGTRLAGTVAEKTAPPPVHRVYVICIFVSKAAKHAGIDRQSYP
jgi:predicted nucleic acid-binding protein